MRPTSPSPDNIDPVSLVGYVTGRLPMLAVLGLTAAALTYGALSQIAPRYQSEAQLTIDAKAGSNPFADPKQAANPADATARMDKEAINTHIGALKSPSLAAEIVAKLKLADRPEFNSARGDVDAMAAMLRSIGMGGVRPGQTEQDRVLEAYTSNLQVFAARESRFISIRFTSVDPQLAAAIPNAVADTYRSQLASRQVDETQDVQDALEPKVAQLVAEVAAADVAVEKFRGKVDAFNAGAQRQSLNEQQLGELTNELSRAQASRSEAEARANAGREMLRGGSGEALPDVQKSPLIQNLVQQRVRVERQIAELNATLLPGHPRMRQLNADLAGLKRQITAEVAKIVDGLTKEAKVSADRETSILTRLAQLKVKVVDAGPDEAKLKTLIADAKSKRDELERLQSQFNANKSRVESKAVPVEAKLVSAASPSSVPVFPKKGAMSGMAGLAAFILGLALTVLRGVALGARSAGQAGARAQSRQPQSRFRDVEPALPQGRFDAAPSGAQPQGLSAKTSTAALTRSASGTTPIIASTVSAVVARLNAQTPERGGYRTLVAGHTDGIDATPVAVALAKGLAAAGQPIILVEWSYGNSRLAELLAIPPTPGTAELVSGASSFEDVITSIPGSDAHVIATGDNLAQSLAHQDLDQINLVLDALDEAYAHIVVTGEHEAVQQLFELIQGRFDAGVVVKRRADGPATGDLDETFLGFVVADMAIMHLELLQPRKKRAGIIA